VPGRGSLRAARPCEAPDGGGSLRSASRRRIDGGAPAGSARTQGRRRKARRETRGEVAGVLRGRDRERSCRTRLGRPAAW
jgi:hypothetical protein